MNNNAITVDELHAKLTEYIAAGELTDRIAQAIGDPGSIVGRKFGPSWGEGNEGYAEQEESTTRWSTRAVLVVLTQPGDVPLDALIDGPAGDPA